MILSDPLCHTATIKIAVSAEKAFEFMTDAASMGEWAYGSWGMQPAKDDVFVGKSLYDGGDVYVRIKAMREILQLDYDVGEDPDMLVPRVAAKIVPGELLGGAPDSCLLTMISWRSNEASDDRWRLTCGSHEAEVFRIKYLIESRYR